MGHLPYQFVVVNLAIVAQPEMRQRPNPHGLHPVQVIHDRQTVEPETAVTEMVDVLNAERIGSPVRDVETSSALFRHVFITAEYRPDSAHVDNRCLNLKQELRTFAS